jgi:hypothetical protein
MNKAKILKPLKRQLKRVRKLRRLNLIDRQAYTYQTSRYLGLEKENSLLWKEESELMAAIHEVEMFIEDRKELGEKLSLIAQLSNFK